MSEDANNDNRPPNQLDYLDFEQPIAELEAKINELKAIGDSADVSLGEEVQRLEARMAEQVTQVFSRLTPWDISRLARHPRRPFTLDYVERMFEDVYELHGDRAYSDDAAIVCGLGSLSGTSVAFIGHQKGRSTKDNLMRNFGMPKPEGYRKALRIMKLAERFGLPVLTFIDTPGAYPGIGAEERGQSEAIARNLIEMAELQVPIIATVIGEGGSGGALAIGVADRVLMLQYATYSVISPEGCASILWKSADRASDAAAAMGITSVRLKELELVDEVIEEPLGGAHRDFAAIAERVREALVRQLGVLAALKPDDLRRERAERLRSFGEYQE
ncbi:MAG: acetyl-CoA carboxylase carboxyltransferase subunit alpha [Gammaproteobacteria bacterium]|nr:acetyl-CoA carboxylase carboxyltransferase subunit alpha [Gammaproteobacteria bacterium]